MLSIIYVSKAKRLLKPQQLRSIEDKASSHNQTKHITGILVYNGEHFMQLIEGEKNDIEKLLEVIKQDERHSDLVVIRRKEGHKRECPDWSMRLFTVPLRGAGSANKIFQSFSDDFQSDTRVIFTSFASLTKEAA